VTDHRAIKSRVTRRRLPALSAHDQPALDALRAIAALAVVVTHVSFQTGAVGQGLAGAVAARLDSGVAVFFVLSGYLLTSPYIKAANARKPAPSPRRYLWHRALRILPAYWVACVAALLFVPQNRNVPPGTVTRNLALIQIYRPGDLLQGFTQTWSLATEAAFYVLLPLLAAAMVRSLRRGRIGSVTVLTALLIAVNVTFIVIAQSTHLLDRSVTGFWLPSFTSWFAAGMALAAIRWGDHRLLVATRSRLNAAAAAPLACWTIAACSLLVASTPLAGPRAFEAVPTAGQAVAKNLLYLVLAVSLTIPLAFGQNHRTRFVRWLSSTTWRFFGEISYGVFLWHLIVLAAVMAILKVRLFTGDFVPVLLVTLWGSVLLATASLFLIERPALRLRNRGPGRRPLSQPADTSSSSADSSGAADGGTVATAANADATAS
jgi:peptidoglycan/LPS O-acetylase OafA/YrhL